MFDTHRSPVLRSFAASFVAALAILTGCSSADPQPPVGQVEADTPEIVRGVPDRGGYPAVVAIDIDDKALCTGTLVAPNVVLTARHCVSKTSDQILCPPPAGARQVLSNRPAASLKIFAGDAIENAQHVANGKELVVPDSSALCDDDIALVVLDRDVEGIDPMELRDQGIAKGDHVVAIGFGKDGDAGPAGVKLVRDHVKVLDESKFEFLVGEATCQGDSGGPAIDEDDGAIVGVVSRGGPSCEGKGAHNVYTRVDAFRALLEDAIARAAGSRHRDAGTRKGGKRPKSDLGAACKKGTDCAAGVCVTEHGKQYCSRACDAHDRCPAHFACSKARGGQSVCVEH